jgi:cyclopropane-fatty-acyl-phospholipid synthase
MIALILTLQIISVSYMVYNYLKPSFIKYCIFKIFNKFNHGNIKMIDMKNNRTIFEKNNNKDEQIVTLHIYNVDMFLTEMWNKCELGIGETYVNGNWSSNDLYQFLLVLLKNRNNEHIPTFNSYNFFNKSLKYDKSNISFHYDLGNDFYETFLTDKFAAYSCGFFINDNTTLDEAQYNKVNTIIKKMNPIANKTILDVGCGWGKIANYVSQQTNCKVTGITISKEQIKFIKDNLPNINGIEKDYRELTQQFDYIYSIGMFEHVRYENYDDFFKMVKRCLSKDGRCVVHTIITTEETDKYSVNETFISKHIFPGAQIPNNDWITNAIMKNDLNIVHTEFFGGQHYARTLRHWRENMMKNKEYIMKWYSKKILDMYEYYFASCEAAFTSGSMGIGHYVITNNNTVNLENNFVYM